MERDNKTDNKKMDKRIQNLAKPNEKKIEKGLWDMVTGKNGSCLKFISPGNNGVPDRLCLLPGGKMWFVETKYPGKEPDSLQLIVHAALERLGFKVRVVSNLEQLKQFENEISAL